MCLGVKNFSSNPPVLSMKKALLFAEHASKVPYIPPRLSPHPAAFASRQTQDLSAYSLGDRHSLSWYVGNSGYPSSRLSCFRVAGGSCTLSEVVDVAERIPRV